MRRRVCWHAVLTMLWLALVPAVTAQPAEDADALNAEVTKLYRQGKYSEATPLAQRSLAISEKALGPDHPDVERSLNNLAGLYRVQGRYAEAEPLYKRSLAITEKALGPDHQHGGGRCRERGGVVRIGTRVFLRGCPCITGVALVRLLGRNGQAHYRRDGYRLIRASDGQRRCGRRCSR